MDHTVRQAKVSDKTLEKNCVTCLALNSPAFEVYAVKTVYFVKWSTQVKKALQLFAQAGIPVIKSIDQALNLCSAMGKGSSKLGGACVLSLAYWQTWQD